MTGRRTRVGAALVAVVALLALGTLPAAAQVGVSTPPPLDGTPPPASLPPSPREATTQSKPCIAAPTGVDPTETPSASPAPAQLGYQRAWAFGKGEGQVVAVIDTGVNPNARLAVVPGGDYVNPDGDGTKDCDGHGSIVAGIIAAKPGPDDSYTGVAPGATILAIRQYSANYDAVKTTSTPARTESTSGFGDLASLASAVVWAADSGAGVINISEAACGPAGTPLGKDQTLGAALRYAVDVKQVVVVVAAGNGPSDTCKTVNDPLGLAAPTTVASPAWWDDYVLTVGSVDADGSPSAFSIDGPWVDVAAPGTGIVGLSPVGGPPLVNQLDGGQIEGTSFATPYVAGTVALVRQAFPQLTARQVIARVEATAHAPAGGRNDRVGYGVVDPVAAVTDVPVVLTPGTAHGSSVPVAATVLPTPPSTTPRTVALVGSAAALAAVVLTLGIVDTVRRARRPRAA